MSELARRFVSRLRRYLGNRRRHKRVQVTLPVSLALSDPHISSNGTRRIPTINGFTLDISETGLALKVPAIRIGEQYLVGTDRTLLLKLDLPDGPIDMSVVPVRYESLEEQESSSYMIGARITGMDSSDRVKFESFLAGLLSNSK